MFSKAQQAQSAGQRSVRPKVVALIVAVTLLGAGLRLYRLADDNLWCDEGISDLVSRQKTPARVMQAVVELDNHPPLYYLLLHGWRRIVGSSDFSLRLLSALLGTAAIPLLFAAGRDLFDDTAGLLAALLLAISPVALHYSQEARMYAMMMPLIAALILFSVRVFRKSDAVAVAGLVIVALVLPGTHFYGVPMVASALLVTGWSLWRRPALRSRLRLIAIIAIVTILACVPWMLAVIQKQLAFAASLPHFARPGPGSVAAVFARFLTPVSTINARGLFALLTVVGGVVLLLVVSWEVNEADDQTHRANSSRLPSREAASWCLWFILGAVALIAAVGFVAPFWVGTRVAAVIAVPLALLLGAAVAGAWRHGRRWQAGLLGALLIAQSMASAWVMHARPWRPDWEGLSRHLEAHERSDDIVLLVHGHWTRPLFDRYYRGVLPSHGVDRDLHHPDLLRGIIDETRAPEGRIWLVMYHERESPLAEILGEFMHEAYKQDFRGPRLWLFEPEDLRRPPHTHSWRGGP